MPLQPTKRLGYHGDAREIRNHRFFQQVNFEKVTRKEIKPPVKFDLDPQKFLFFDQRLIKRSPKDTPVSLENQKYSEFTNFTYQKMYHA
jgi:hypothetical protein